MKKRLFSFLVAICLVIPCLCLVGCNDTKSSKVMTLKVNPEIEFVLDKDNKVVSVNALNEDCYAILTATWGEGDEAKTVSAQLVNMDADEAAELFIKVCNQEHFIQVNATTNVEISISGDKVNNLYNEVKTAIENVELEANNIVLECEKLAKITKDELVATAQECYKELSEDYLNELTEEELIAKIKESRDETKEFLNTQVKEFYYQMREKYVLMARLEAAKVDSLISANIDNVIDLVNRSISTLQTTFAEQFATFEGKANEYIEAKKAWLAKNVTGVTAETLENLNQTITNTKNALNSAIETAQNAINSALSTINNSIDTAMNNLLDFISQIPNYETQLNAQLEIEMGKLNARFAVGGDSASLNINFWATPTTVG